MLLYTNFSTGYYANCHPNICYKKKKGDPMFELFLIIFLLGILVVFLAILGTLKATNEILDDMKRIDDDICRRLETKEEK